MIFHFSLENGQNLNLTTKSRTSSFDNLGQVKDAKYTVLSRANNLISPLKKGTCEHAGNERVFFFMIALTHVLVSFNYFR